MQATTAKEFVDESIARVQELASSNAGFTKFSLDDLKQYNSQFHRQVLQQYNQVLEKEETNVAALLCRAMLCATILKNRKQTLSDFQGLIQQLPSDSNMLGFVYRTRALIAQNVTDGINDCRKAIEVNPKDSDAYLTMSSLYQSSTDFNNALECLNNAIDSDPNNLAAYHSRAALYTFELNQPSLALQDYSKCLELDSHNGYMWRERGYLYENYLQDYENALYDYTQAITVSTEPLVEFYESKYTLLRDKLLRTDEAQQVFHQMQLLNP
jgi:tetratricopeptide (TPR) repeat protein